MKILLLNAPFIKYNDNFLNIEKEILKDKIRKTINYLFDYNIPKSIENIFNLKKSKTTTGFRYGVRAGSRWPWTSDRPHGDAPYPFMLGYSASLLKENGFEVDVIDAVASEIYSYNNFIKLVKNKKPDIVILECAQITMDIDLWCAKKISKFAQVALAGPHFTKDEAEKIKKRNKFVKYILMGEYIKSSLKMAQTQMEGIYESEIVEDLDSIPFPYRNYCGADKCFEVTMPTPKPQLQIYASKGCPFKCKFCMWPQTMYKGNVAKRSPKKVAQEIKENVEKYGYKSVFFDDDTFNIGTERISELCDYLKEIGLPWTMMGRLDCSPNWLYDKMVESGCVGMRFGVETFNLDCLKRINKGLERADFLGTLKHITTKFPDIWVHITMMKDMPGQSEEIHKEDMKILDELGFKLYGSECSNKTFQLSRCVPYPGTKLYEEMCEILGEDFVKNNTQYDGNSDTIMSKLNKERFWDNK